MTHGGDDVRYVVVTQSHFQLEEPTEAFLLSELDGLERECDSVRSCRVHLLGRARSLCVALILSTGEHDIKVMSCERTSSALTERDVIRNAIAEAANELRKLKLSAECATCSDASESVDSNLDVDSKHGRAA